MFYAESTQKSVGKLTVWSVNAFGKENVIARLKEREIDQRDGALATRRDDGAVAALQLTDATRQFECGWRAIETIGVAGLILVPVIADRGCGVVARIGLKIS